MSRQLTVDYPFPRTYEVEQLDRIERLGGKRALGYPDAIPLDPQQELAEGPILEIAPYEGDPWIGVFRRGEYQTPAAVQRRVIGWPDERSVCVIYAGGGVVVRSDDPLSTYEIDSWVITGVAIAPERKVIVFGDPMELVAYGPDGLIWRTGRIALDDLRIDGVDGDVLRVRGFFGGRLDPFTVDLADGRPAGQPFDP